MSQHATAGAGNVGEQISGGARRLDVYQNAVRRNFALLKQTNALDELMAKSLPPTGTQNIGGPAVTAGGLIFIAAARDEKLRAFDTATGKILWEYKLPAGGYATPAIYGVDGKQYVVIAAGGGGKVGTKSGDTYVAFKLKE